MCIKPHENGNVKSEMIFKDSGPSLPSNIINIGVNFSVPFIIAKI